MLWELYAAPIAKDATVSPDTMSGFAGFWAAIE